MSRNVSVILPTLNVEDTIDYCIGGLLKQTVQPDEILVVDGGSTDSTLRKLSELGIIPIAQNIRGIGAARRIAVEKSRNNIILSTDGDTMLDSNFIEYGAEDLIEKQACAAFGKIRSLTEEGRIWEVPSNAYRKARGYNTIFKKECCSVSYCYTTEGRKEDWDLIEDLSKRGHIIYDERLIAYTSLPTHLQKNIAKVAKVSIPVVLPIILKGFVKTRR